MVFAVLNNKYITEGYMNLENILNSQLDISSVSDESGGLYFNLKVTFADGDALTVYRKSMDELLEDLPQIVVSAVRARILQNEVVYS
jgi:hypothetical protein